MAVAHRSARMQLGMTLIEVMISLAVMSMMIVAVWSSFRGTLRGMETTEAMQDRYAIIRNGLSRMEAELSMAYLSFNRPVYDPKHYTLFEGRDSFQTDDLTFSAFAHLRVRKHANESDQSVIQYFLEADPEEPRRTHLYRRESRRLTGDRPEDLENFFPAYVLIEDVESFDLKYWDPRQNDWVDEWRTTQVDMQPDRLPERVRIELGVKDVDGEIIKFTAQAIPLIRERLDLAKK